MLEIVALKYNDIEPVLPINRQLPATGGTIGRGDDNAMVLPDPLRVLSRRHLLIEPDGQGAYRLTNISGNNPALLNNAPLAPGESRPLKHADQIFLGGYLLDIRIGAPAQPAQPAQPVQTSAQTHALEQTPAIAQAASVPVPAHDGIAPVSTPDEADRLPGEDIQTILKRGSTRPLAEVDPLGAAGIERSIGLSDLAENGATLLAGLGQDNPPPALSQHAPSPDILIQDPLNEAGKPLWEDKVLDPLALFGGEQARLEDWFGGSAGTQTPGTIPAVSELHTPFSLEALQPDAPVNGQMPAQALMTDGFTEPGLTVAAIDSAQPTEFAEPANSMQNLLASVPSEAVLPETVLPKAVLPETVPPETMPLTDTPHRAEQEAAEVAEVAKSAEAGALPPPGARIEPPAESLAEHSPPSPAAATPTSTATDDPGTLATLQAALLEGLQLPSLPEQGPLDPALMRTLGVLLRTSIAGTLRLMAARAAVKREVRANVTVIAPARNNPLKFSPDAEVALTYLLGPDIPGFMASEDAVEQAFADLLQHQIGVVSGMRSALSLVLERFDPERISHSTNTGMFDRLLSVGHKARLWDAYGRYFASTREQAQDRFQEFFGAAFVDAYEGQMQANDVQTHDVQANETQADEVRADEVRPNEAPVEPAHTAPTQTAPTHSEPAPA